MKRTFCLTLPPLSVHKYDELCSLCECKLVFCSVLRRLYVGRIYSSIAKESKFDWSIRVT